MGKELIITIEKGGWYASRDGKCLTVEGSVALLAAGIPYIIEPISRELKDKIVASKNIPQYDRDIWDSDTPINEYLTIGAATRLFDEIKQRHERDERGIPILLYLIASAYRQGFAQGQVSK